MSYEISANEVFPRGPGTRSVIAWLAFSIAFLWSVCAPTALYAKADDACAEAFTSGAKIDPEDAIAKISFAIDGNARSWQCFYYRAALYKVKGDLDKAMLDSNRAVELAPNKELLPHELRAGLYAQAQRWDDALADCDLVLARNRKNINCLLYRGVGLSKLKRYSDAVTALDEVLQIQNQLTEGTRAALYRARGESVLFLNRYAEAIDGFDKALSLGASDDSVYLQRGIAEWKLGQLDKAREDAAVLLQRQPRLQLKFAGDHQLELFDMDKRRSATNDAVASAQAAEARGDFSASFEAWNTALSYGSSFMQDGQAIHVQVLDGVVRTYTKLAAAPPLPELARKYKVEAETYYQDKNVAKAIASYGKLNGVAPWFPEAYFNRALLEGEEQQYAAAIADMGIYLKLMPNAEDARAAQDKIYIWQAKLK
jgi:tetratricopeptide (TPR) repeat protein